MLDEKVIIVGLQTDESDRHFEYSMEELGQLVQTAGGQLVDQVLQKRNQVNPKSFIGKGKLLDLARRVEDRQVDTVVFNQALTPSQVRNIQDQVPAKIIDRMQLILDIFAMRAKSKEGRLQVELAQHQYLLPRLVGQGLQLSRLGGGIGTRGPGETQLESDRRHIQGRIHDIKKELEKVQAHRQRNRQRRQNQQMFQIGLVGYTNAGKSTILNALTEADSLEEDALFATLDPLTRRYELQAGMQVTLTDTVGFIQDLPTELIEAFQSTLEETQTMDMLIHVIDASSDYLTTQEDTVVELLTRMGADQLPRLTVYNKVDLADDSFTPQIYPNVILSARRPEDIDRLRLAIDDKVKEQLQAYQLILPADQAYLLHDLKVNSLVDEWTFDEDTNAYQVKGYAKVGYPLAKIQSQA